MSAIQPPQRGSQALASGLPAEGRWSGAPLSVWHCVAQQTVSERARAMWGGAHSYSVSVVACPRIRLCLSKADPCHVAACALAHVTRMLNAVLQPQRLCSVHQGCALLARAAKATWAMQERRTRQGLHRGCRAARYASRRRWKRAADRHLRHSLPPCSRRWPGKRGSPAQ